MIKHIKHESVTGLTGTNSESVILMQMLVIILISADCECYVDIFVHNCACLLLIIWVSFNLVFLSLLSFSGVCGCVWVSECVCGRGLSVMGVVAWLKSLFVLQLLIGFVFVVSGLIINFIQLCTCVLWPIDKQLYRKINTRLSYSLWSRELFLSQLNVLHTLTFAYVFIDLC